MNDKKLMVEIQENSTELFSRKDILRRAGVYKQVNNNHMRFVSSGQREIFVFGDGCPLYKTAFPDETEKNLVEVKEKIVFQPIE